MIEFSVGQQMGGGLGMGRPGFDGLREVSCEVVWWVHAEAVEGLGGDGAASGVDWGVVQMGNMRSAGKGLVVTGGISTTPFLCDAVGGLANLSHVGLWMERQL